ncbi:DUF4214 domain-containing protein [Subtercola sp. PAMC28395]|uniref:DUF4214 domain-containing protein n=1 Tax=Subtercola sp. PAMC28395 TaxID=2846775 RepID=UPI001C0D6E6F|nr:DUF4214 domain-containing protein [Subtercola sp. PAMC28395]QWT23093.1 DUF4214 domain-containing protein [Subtercola sp. PAMC28395]
MNRILAALVVGILSTTSIVLADSAQATVSPTTASISGVVTDSSGAPRAGAFVVPREYDSNGNDLSSYPSEFYAVTAADGSYTISGLTPDHYHVEFTSFDVRTIGDALPQTFDAFWGGTTLNPNGTAPFALAAGENKTGVSMSVPTSTIVNGDITCVGCTFNVKYFGTFYLFISVNYYDPQTATWVQLYTIPINGYDMNWNAIFYFPGTFRFDILQNGEKGYQQTNSQSVVIDEGQALNSNLTMTQLPARVTGVPASTQSFITALYSDYLGRTPANNDIAFWSNQFSIGAPRSAVSAGFVNSDEYRLSRINAAYQTILGRGADPAGRLDWLHWMQQGRITTDDIETSFYASDEYFNKQGGTNKQFVNAIYQTLLHRGGTDTDYAFWSNLVQQHDRAWVIARFWDSTETISERVSLMYAHYLGRTPDPSGLATWVGLALQIGDSGLRAGLTCSDEYFSRSAERFPISG